MRPALWLLISCTACHRAAVVGFSVQPLPEVVQVEQRHRLSLELGIGFDGELEQQRWDQQGSARVRLERTEGGVVVRCLEASQREGEIAAPSGLEGLSARVTSTGVESTDDSRPLTEEQRSAMAGWASTVEPDALQVVLWSKPVRLREPDVELDEAFASLARKALGAGGRVQRASLTLATATDAVAVFDAAVTLRSERGTLEMTSTLTGTFTIARAGAVPLSLALEGPVEVSAPERDATPALHGSGQLQVLRQLRLVEAPPAAMAER